MATRLRLHQLGIMLASASAVVGCTFTEHLVDKNKFFTPEMRLNDFLPDGGLPDITMQIVPGIWAGGAGGGSAGACWDCGCRRPGLPASQIAPFWLLELGEIPRDYFTGLCCANAPKQPPGVLSCTCKKETAFFEANIPTPGSMQQDHFTDLADWLGAGGAPLLPDDKLVAGIQDDVAGPQEPQDDQPAGGDDAHGKAGVAGGEPWQLPAADKAFTFVDKGEKDAAPAEKKRCDMLLEVRGTGAFDKPTSPELIRLDDQLYYLKFDYGLTSNSSLWLEVVDFEYAPPEDVSDPVIPDTLWTRVLWERLTSTAARTQVEFGSRWTDGAHSGLRASGAYNWDAGFNLNLTARLHVSQMDDQWGGQMDIEAQAAVTPDTCMWARGSYYSATASRSEAAKFSAGMARHLGSGTGIHAGVYLGNARDVDEVAGITAASSAFVRFEVRHMLQVAGTLLRGGYVQYFDSWDITADSAFFKVERWFKNGLLGAGYRFYATSEGYEAGTWMVTAEYKW